MISIIIPTYNEADNIGVIVPRISQVLDGENFEILIIDDNSPDGTAQVASKLSQKYPVKIHVRREERGLSGAVIKGFEICEGDICVVMDADLSHPVEKLPAMVKPILENRCDATVGSRYMAGGGSEDWTLLRRWISRGAGLLAGGVTTLSDPTSGFMAIRRPLVGLKKLDPLGWKIVLETVVKTSPRILEIPIVFVDRKAGESKLDLKAQMDYLRHLWRLYGYKHPHLFEFLKFCLVGISGLLVDTAVLVSLVSLFSADPRLAAIFAFAVAVSWNYVFNRHWSFDFGRSTRLSYSYASFVSICLVGLGIRIGVMHLLIEYAEMGKSPWYVLASIIGILSATIFNFFGSKYIAFSKLFSRT